MLRDVQKVGVEMIEESENKKRTIDFNDGYQARHNWSFVELVAGDRIKDGTGFYRNGKKRTAYKWEGPSKYRPDGLTYVKFMDSDTGRQLDGGYVSFLKEPWLEL